MPETPSLVGSGSFKVDRQRALEKLKDFQLPDADMFLLPWIRCAVASGATHLTLDRDSSKISFDGQGFTREELADPYACLFDETASAAPRNRQLAYALLATLRRLNGVRPELRVKPGTDTVVKLELGEIFWYGTGHGDYPEGEKCLEYALDRHIPQLISIRVLPKRILRRPQREADHTLEFQKGSLRGWLHVPGRPSEGAIAGRTLLGLAERPPRHSLRLSNFGVFVESAGGRSVTSTVPVEGTINDNEFELNVSQSSVVRNERYNSVMREVRAQAEGLVSQVCGTQAARMQATGTVLKSSFARRAWGLWMRQGEKAEASVFWMELSLGEQMRYLWKYITSLNCPDPEWAAEKNRRLIWSTARVTDWLRYLCALARKDQLAVAEKTLSDLRGAPIFWGLSETVLSMADLESTLLKLGYVPVSAQKAEGNPRPYPVVWAWCAEERAALGRIFPGQLTDITETVTGPTAGTATSEAPQSGLLERVGQFDLLIRGRFDTDRAWGEVSLSTLRVERLLCFLAAADITNLVKNPNSADHLADQVPEPDQRALETAAVAVARNLYRRLAEEVSGTDSFWQLRQRDWAILQHLQNFLFWVRTSGHWSKEDRWIDSYPLFFTNAGTRWSFLKLREFLDTGQALFLHGDLTAVEAGKVALRGVALRGVAPEFLLRMFPDATAKRVPDLQGVTEMTRRSPASAALPLSEKEIVQPPTQQETAPTQTEAAQMPAVPEKQVVPALARAAEQIRETEPPPAEAAPPHEPPVEYTRREFIVGKRALCHKPAPYSSAVESGGDPRVLQLAHDILSHLRGRRGMKLLGQTVPLLRLQRPSDAGLLDIRGEESWDLNAAHPLTKAMLDCSLPDSEKSAYLASVVYTAANRNLASVTDQDDVKFQQALADQI